MRFRLSHNLPVVFSSHSKENNEAVAAMAEFRRQFFRDNNMTSKISDRERRDPNLVYNVSGLMDYSLVRYPKPNVDRRIFGWNLGRQLIAQYLAEILLKCAYAKHRDDNFPHTHHLAHLFQNLPAAERQATEVQYKKLLNAKAEWTWDIFKTVKSFLAFLGRNPFTETRYYWDKRSLSNTLGVRGFQGLMAPEEHGLLVASLYIALHGYPSLPLNQRYVTKYRSIRRALKNKSTSSAFPQGALSNLTDGKAKRGIDPRLIYNVEGVLDYFQETSPYKSTDHRSIGWSLGRQVVAQYLVEIILKCAHLKYVQDVLPHGHSLRDLFYALPATQRQKVEDKYKEILHSAVKSTWDVFQTVESFLAFLGTNPITESRYYWDKDSVSNTLGVCYFQGLVSPDSYRPLIYSLYIILHGYPSSSMAARYDTKFESLRQSLHNEPGSTRSDDTATP